MKFFIQRVLGHCEIKYRDKSSFFEGPGLVVLMSWLQSDKEGDLEKKETWLIERVRGLRIFPDKEGRSNLSLSQYLLEADNEGGGILWVPQFTLAGELKSGFRPSFVKALEPGLAKERFLESQHKISSQKVAYKNIFGEFGADMQLNFCNWGPFSLMLEK